MGELGNAPCGKAGRPRLHQKAVDNKPGLLRKRRQRLDDFFRFHNLIIVET